MHTPQLFRHGLFAAALVALFTWTQPGLLGQGGAMSESFDDPSLPGWELGPGAEVSNGVLRVPAGGFGFWGITSDGLSLSLRAKLTGEGELIIGYSSSDDGMYQIALHPEFFILRREASGMVQEMASAPGGVRLDEWFQLGVQITDGEHQISLNGQTLLAARDPEPLPPGGIFLHARGAAAGEFDDLVLEAAGEHASLSDSAQEPDGTSAAIHEPAWTRTGGPPGGLGYDIRYNFTNPNMWYATDNYAGVHISTDNGFTWFPSNTGVPKQSGPTGDAIPVFCLTVDPHESQIVWIGTDITGHIYKSTDSGHTWVEKNNGITMEYDTLTFRGFTVDPRSSDIVYAMGETSSYPVDPASTGVSVGGVIYRTTDGGDHWQKIWDGGMPSSLTRYLWINPQDPNVLYASTGIFDRAAVGEAPDWETNPDPFGGLGILKSNDGGQTWRLLNEANGLAHLYIGSLFMHPDDPNILLAAAGHTVPEMAAQQFEADGHSPLGIYRTTDGGESWTQVLEAQPRRRYEVFSSVELCPSDPGIGYAGSDIAVYRTDDAGITWALVSGGSAWGPPGVRAGWPIDMQCDPRDPNRVFANNYSGGNVLSEDGGRTWRNASDGYTGAQIINLAVDPFDGAHVFAVGRSGAWESNDGGATWHGLQNLPAEFPFAGGEWGGAGADPSRPSHIFLGSEQLLEQTDEGWRVQTMPFPFGPMASAIVFAPSDPLVVYVAAGEHNCMVHHSRCPPVTGLAVSHDGGTTWQDLAPGQFSGQAVLDLTVDPFSANTVYAAAETGLFSSTNGGASWERFNGLPEGQARMIAVSPADSQLLMTSIHERGFFVSHDGGESWQQVTAGLEPNGSHHKVVFDPVNPHVVYTTDTFSGIYQSSDGGLTWRQINDGLDSRAVTGLAISSDGRTVYAGTNGAGVYRLDVHLDGTPSSP